jgi:hypothetical protein
MNTVILVLITFATSIIGHGITPDWEFRLLNNVVCEKLFGSTWAIVPHATSGFRIFVEDANYATG